MTKKKTLNIHAYNMSPNHKVQPTLNSGNQNNIQSSTSILHGSSSVFIYHVSKHIHNLGASKVCTLIKFAH